MSLFFIVPVQCTKLVQNSRSSVASGASVANGGCFAICKCLCYGTRIARYTFYVMSGASVAMITNDMSRLTSASHTVVPLVT